MSFKSTERGSVKSWAKDDEECDTCEALGALDKMRQISMTIKGESSKTEKQNTNPPATNTKSQISEEGDEQWKMKTPPDTVELGNAGWTLLHTVAAYYPQNPSTEKQSQVLNFLQSFSQVYPCNYCAKDFHQDLQENPPKLENQKEFSKWMCEAHNRVNTKLGKPTFDCSFVDQRWKREITKTKEQ